MADHETPGRPPPLATLLQQSLPVVHIVDVGAAVLDESPRFAALTERGAAMVTAFEPDAEQHRRLVEANLPGYQVRPHALGRGGPGLLRITRFPGCTSLYEPDPQVIDLFTGIDAGSGAGNFTVVGEQRIWTHRLDDIEDLPPPDYIKLDVQGGELDILAGGIRALNAAVVVECEVEFVPIYKGQPLIGEVASFMRQAGFILHKLMDVTGRALRPMIKDGNIREPLSQLLWADALFVRDFTRLPLWTTEQLLKAAVVLHDVYDSVDLAALLLREVDRRQPGGLSERYGAALSGAAIPMTMVTLKQLPPLSAPARSVSE